MIRIIFPFIKNSFVIDAPSIIESHIAEKFITFTEKAYTDKNDTQSVILTVKNENIIIYSKKAYKSYNLNYRSYYDAFKKIMSFIRENSITYGNICALHASYVRICNKGVLFLGESGSGKSTLAAYLHMMPGCECYADDVVYINYNTMITQCSAQYINLRTPSLKLFSEMPNIIYDSFINRCKIKLNNSYEAKTDYIIFLNRKENSNTQIEKLNNPVELFAQNMYLPYSVRENILASVKLATNKNIYKMTFSDLWCAYCVLRYFESNLGE